MNTDLIFEIEHELKGRKEEYVRRIERSIAQLVVANDTESIILLLQFLDDESEFDELMFSIIHAVEKLQDEQFIDVIIAKIGSIFSTSPRWATVILMRILNSPSSMAVLSRKIENISEENWQSIRAVIVAVRNRHSRFDERCGNLLKARRDQQQDGAS